MAWRNWVNPHNRSYFGLEFAYETIPNQLVPFDYDTFEAYPGTVEAVVTNLDTGLAEYLPVPRRDDHNLLLQATCAIPLMFPIYHLEGRPYLDGGCADAIPWRRAFEAGCDRVAVVAGGKIVECGTHEQLMEQEGLYRQMFLKQAEYYKSS